MPTTIPESLLFFKNIILKPIVATILMSFAIILCQKICVYINVGEIVTMGISIIAAMLTYFYAILKFKTLSNDELSQIPYGNKICHLIEK